MAEENEPTRSELIDLYKIAIDEYRFQVNLNWSRTQYYLALNVGIIGIATGILQLASGELGLLVAALYLVGSVCCGLALAATHVQRQYYQEARSHKKKLEDALQLGELSILTTRGMGNQTIRRLGKVTTLINVVLSLLAIINIAGMVGVLVSR